MIRAKVVAEHARLIAGAGVSGGAKVTARYPGEKHLTKEMVFANGTDGAVSFPYAMEGERIQKDQFSALWVVRVTGSTDIDASLIRRDELAAEVVRVMADTASALLAFSANGENVCGSPSEERPIQVTTREGDDPKTGRPIAIAEITVPYETQTTNEEA